MDLRNLSATPNQLDPVMQRRPSLSSLSSTSGYSSSNYGGGAPGGGVPGGTSGSNSNNNPGSNGNTTPQLTNQRLSIGSRNNLNLQSSWLQNQSNATNVAPWVEQQQQQLDSKQQVSQSTGNSSNPSSSGGRSASQSSQNVQINNTNQNGDETDIDADDEDDDVIPTAIVIKNIPFAIKKEQLLDVMTKLNLPIPYAFNYHFDNGVFRGLAFANFTSTDETSLVVNQLNGREIGGRKLRVEYKKMLPVQERERIEREKREKRGQLEEQHRSASNASLASLLSAASTTAATKNLSVNGISNSNTERLFFSFPSNTSAFIPTPPLELNFNDPETLDLYTQLILYRDDPVKSVFELAIAPVNLNMNQRKVLSILCNFLSLLELFDNGLVIIRRKPGYIPQQSNTFASPQSQQQSSQQSQQQGLGPSHSSSMMNLNQLGQLVNTPTGSGIPNNAPIHPELLRSQSQSSIPLPRLRQQTGTPTQSNFPQYSQQQQQQSQQQSQQPQSIQLQSRSYSQFGLYQQTTGGNSVGTGSGLSSNNQIAPPVVTPTMISSSAAALLRSSNNRSYVDVRSTPPLGSNNIYSNQQSQLQHNSNQAANSQSVTNSPTPQHHSHILHQQHQSQTHSHHLNQPISLSQSQSQQHQHQNQNQHQHHSNQNQNQNQQNHPSQPSTPFQPFQHSGSFTSLQQANSNGLDDFSDPLGKFSGLNLGPSTSASGNFDTSSTNNTSSGIWGPK
ncbi:uncharacterized protein RJT21DRAFT_41853 [Scheffersomyces amazonensis]|uniref:uncharacterized protein n=1 Tax=Scheffersomyces amazonensis TaxID=1078765 RepID=UPI00315D72E3